MEFTVNSGDFKNLVNKVFPALGTRAELPAYTCIKIAAIPDGIVLESFDMSLSMRAIMSTPVQTQGAFGVPGKALHDIVSKLPPEGELHVKRAEGYNRLLFTNGKSTIHLNIIDGEHFPIMAEFHTLPFTEIKPGLFSKIDKVSFCVSTDENRYILQGVHFTKDALVSIDGHRMAILNTDVPVNREAFTLPADSIKRVRKSFDDNEPLSIYEGENQVHFWQKNVMATMSKIEGKYPNYNQVIPRSPYDIAKVHKDALKTSLNLLSILTDKKNSVTFEFGEGRLGLKCNTQELGAGEDFVECDFPKDVTIALNAKYLTQAIEHLDGAGVLLELRDSKSPVVIREENYVQVIMPQRLETP